ncbi:MAG TPA: dienelactone hydrolase family protein [Candidatus Binataceae bacterium]|jgi:carboxymethylenebutenolidase|nr:dienelactone hydrolase family protein [Candidatus Binataceae bacterium]
MAVSTKTVTVTTADGGKFAAYLALPESGGGPGLVLLQEILGVNRHIRELACRYAEEGYVTIAPDLFWRIEPGVDLGYTEAELKRAFDLYARFDADQAVKDIADTLAALRSLSECNGKAAVLGFCLGGMLAYLTAARCNVEAAVSYYGVGIEKRLGEARAVRCPLVMHFGEADEYVPAAARAAVAEAFSERDETEIYTYTGAGHGFNNPVRPNYDRFAASLAHSRTLGVLRRAIGPRFDLSALWERHADLEFKYRDADATMATMVERPYVNHVPTMTGGIGRQELHRFYKHHFISRLPKDTRIVPISRTVGPDRLVDEILLCFTHDTEVDFLLPGVAPTGKYVEIPTVAIVQFRGDKLVHEHIHWDQATALVQLGLLDPKGLPVAGHETVEKLCDESHPSNTLMERWKESEGKG